MKLFFVFALAGTLWLAIIVLANRCHVRHYRYLLRIARRGKYEKESIAALRAGQIAGAAVVIPLIVALVILDNDLTTEENNGIILAGLTLGLALTYSAVRSSQLTKKRKSRQ
ncbi:MAG: hypothetical protein IT363_01875 [Methanoregulaceae archaeon]|nr:hypothetical protein [Methanoregulaceae archaeon]